MCIKGLISQRKLRKKLISAAVCLVMTSSALARDDTKGFLTGHVFGLSVQERVQIVITITNEEQGTTRTTTINSDGSYRLPALKSGTYSILLSNKGEPVSKQEKVYIGIGEKTVHNFSFDGDIEVVEVVGKQVSIDTSSAVKDFVVNTDELLARVPVARDLSSVAMLSPSASHADNSFSAGTHDAAALSLGGASVAENACFVNGLNTTNFRNGLGCSQVPFEFYEQIQVKNGGYNAEFGRSIGGVMNATTKSGGNQFHAGFSTYWEPDTLRGDKPDTYSSHNNELEKEHLTLNAWASGYLVQDKLFFYALYSPDKRSYTRESLGQLSESQWNDEFWGLKLDYIITDGHTLEYTGFDDTRVEVEDGFNYNESKGEYVGTTTYTRGGENHGLKYTAVLAEWLTLNMQYGVNKYQRVDASSADVNPVIYDRRTGTTQIIGAWTNSIARVGFDEREAMRMDIDLFVGDHNIRIGIDHENNTAVDEHFYSGHIRYDYYTATQNSLYVRRGLIEEGDEYVRVRRLESQGEFETKTSAFYLQDEWQLHEQWTLHMGIRNEAFDNRNAEGSTFIELDEQWSPRFGVSFDPTGDESSRIYANYGRYYLPIAANTNIRMAGAEFSVADFYLLQDLNADDTPIYNSSARFANTVYADGEVPDVREILDTSIEPMYQDEYIVGYDWTAFEHWQLGVRFVYRDLKSTIEDIAVDAALNDYVLNNFGIEDFASGFNFYVLTNPGSDLTFSTDIDGDGVLDPITLTADSLGYPKASRKYKALEFTFERLWDEQWMMGGSLVLASSKGNHEGYVKSDNGQTDAGLTSSFDQPGLTDGSYGYLPNDRRWTVKAWGSYQFQNGLMVGANFLGRDGRPINCIGNHPTDEFAQEYGSESFYCGGELIKRGSVGRTPNIYNVDVSAQYTFELSDKGTVVVRADIFNVFDWSNEVEVREYGELSRAGADPNYGKPTYFQEERKVRFSALYNF